MKFEYLILSPEPAKNPTEVVWFEGNKKLGSNLPAILNDFGKHGWEVITVGDVGFNSRPEILLKRAYS